VRPNFEALIRRATRAPWDPAMLVAVGVMLLVVALWVARAPGPSARAALQDVDTSAVDGSLAELRSRWQREFASLRDGVRRLALDDATYEFARRPNFPYVDDHFGPRQIAALGVDTILITNAEGRPIFWRRPNDAENRGFPDAEAFLATLPALPPPARREARGKPVLEGIAQFRGAPMLVSVIAIEPASGDGAPRGYLVYGRALDGAVSERVLDGAPAGIDVMPARDPLIAPEVRIRLEQMLAPVVVADAQRVRGYLPLVDLQGRLLRIYAASAPRAVPPPGTRAVTGEPAAATSSWLVVVGATLLLLAIGAGGLWWAFAPGLRSAVRGPFAQAAGGPMAEPDRATVGAPDTSKAMRAPRIDQTERGSVGEPRAPLERLAQALAARSHGLEPHVEAFASGADDFGRGHDEHEPTHARGHADEGRGSDGAVAEAMARLRAGPGADDHEWMIGTPDEILVGEPLASSTPTHDGASADDEGPLPPSAFEYDDVYEGVYEDAPARDGVAELDDVDVEPATVTPAASVLPAASELVTVPFATPAGASAPLAAAAGVVLTAPRPASRHSAMPLRMEDAPRESDRDGSAPVHVPATAPLQVPATAPAPPAAPALLLAARAREAVVRGLLEAGHLRVHYQPQVTTGTQQVVGVEALVRWEDEEAALRAASDLFGEGTSADAFAGATEFVLQTACADRRSWLRQVGRTWPVAVNVGLAELREPGFVERVLRVLERNELPPAYLELEVPERALAQLGTPECDALDRAYRHGLSIAVGGFTAADAPLRVLSQVPISKLKIHRALVADVPDCVNARTVVDTVLAIGRTLGVTVCAEGVETAAQAAYLEMKQCPAAQGWYYSRALDADQLLQLVRGSGVDTVTLPLMNVEELEAHARAAGVV
jgi:EAL domain-containing protein (putative c-di-GMP-specific phosphodiesterase class I)/sensor domain CHASE-containing protein